VSQLILPLRMFDILATLDLSLESVTLVVGRVMSVL